MARNPSTTYPGERTVVLAEQRREGWAGFGAAGVIGGIAIASWLALSAPQNAASLSESVVPAADAATLFTSQKQAALANQNLVLTAADETAKVPLTIDDVIKVQTQLASLGFNPGKADGQAGPHTMKALNDYRKSLGLAPIEALDREAVSPLLP